MTSLNEQCSLGSGTDEKFLSAAYASLKDNPLLIKPKMGNNVKFIVQHTVGEIEYDVVGFLFKNKDILRAELVEVIQASENSVSRALFEGVAVVKGKIDTNFIGSQFMKQLDELMALINQTEPHFVRCVKSNEKKQPLCFDQAKVWGQLTALSILEALQLRTLGYSYRRPFEDFLYQFRFIDLGIAEDSSRDAKERSQALMKAAGVDKGWQCGKTMMFLFADVAKDLVNKMRAAMAAWEPLCAKIEAMYLRKVYKDMVEKLDDSAVRFQALCRKKLVGKVKAPPPGQEVRGW